jgi:2-dehydro-3-deoxyphosphogluconate aldolase/(4S)-4-hydroxy-2-oxoglutarate aldolase
MTTDPLANSAITCIAERTARADAVLRRAPVIPVIVIDEIEAAVPLARALVAGGLSVLEITLRTPRALACLAAMATVPGAVVGAGTVLDDTQMRAAEAAGARFLIAPGHTPELFDAADRAGIPFIPGVASAGEAMAAAARGYRRLKFFPAENVGGAAHLRALAGPLADLAFCPTGGITAEKAPGYLALPNVVCVGGSWVTPSDAIAAGDWEHIERLASAAAALRLG